MRVPVSRIGPPARAGKIPDGCTALSGKESDLLNVPHPAPILGTRRGALAYGYLRNEEAVVFCDRCGTSLSPGGRFCPTCGKAAGTVPLMPVRNRISGHVRLLGILWLALSVFRLLPGVLLWSFFGHGGAFLPFGVPMFVHGLLRIVGMLFIALAAIGIVAGWGLLERQPWARTLAIVVAFLNLLDMPFGTALGVYTLWVLLPAESEKEYLEVSRAA